MSATADHATRLRGLADVLQVATGVGAVICLGLPWWTHLTASGDSTTASGWQAMGHGPEAHGWLLLVGVVAGAVATVVDRRWARRTACVVAVLLALLLVLGASQTDGLDDYDAHQAVWTAAALLALGAFAQAAALVHAPRA